jgi:hypothetical protein
VNRIQWAEKANFPEMKRKDLYEVKEEPTLTCRIFPTGSIAGQHRALRRFSLASHP